MKAATAVLLWITSPVVSGSVGRSTSNTPATSRLEPAMTSNQGTGLVTPRRSMPERSRTPMAIADTPKA